MAILEGSLQRRRRHDAIRAAGACLLALLLLLGCASDPAAPSPVGDVRIRLEVGGGLVGVGYSIVADGSAGAVLGETCTRGCDFDSGDTLMLVGQDRIRDWAARLERGGIINLDGTDYGTECCDQFYVVLTYADGFREAEVRGTDSLLPSELRSVVAELHGVTAGTLSVLIDWDADPASLPADPITVEAVRLGGALLELDVSFGGGCAAHEFDARAVGGWMESFPVQVRLLVTHDGNDDPCDALLRRTLRFDLTPLAREYERAYPGETPGERRLIVHLDTPSQDPPGSVTFQF